MNFGLPAHAVLYSERRPPAAAEDGRPPIERVVDSGAIAATSLKLATNGRSVSYSKDGTTLKPPLR